MTSNRFCFEPSCYHSAGCQQMPNTISRQPQIYAFLKFSRRWRSRGWAWNAAGDPYATAIRFFFFSFRLT